MQVSKNNFEKRTYGSVASVIVHSIQVSVNFFYHCTPNAKKLRKQGKHERNEITEQVDSYFQLEKNFFFFGD